MSVTEKNIFYVYKTFISVECLDEYSLANIFSFLPISQRFDIERVCQKWKKAVAITWLQTRFLNITRDVSFGPHHASWENFIESILHRCGSHLRSLGVSGLKNNDLPKFINDNCPRLISLGLGYNFYEEKSIYIENMKNLHFIHINNIYHWDENPLTSLLDSNLPDTLKIIKCNGFDENQNKLIPPPAFLDKLSLRTLEMIQWPIFRDLLEKMCRKLPDFIELRLAHSIFLSDSIYLLSNFVHVERIDLCGVSQVTDNLLNDLSLNCKKINSLDISGCLNVTDQGIQKLTRLKSLEILGINNLPKISGLYFNYFTTLKKLYCQQCPGLTDNSVKMILDNSLEIKVLSAKSPLISKNLWNLPERK